MSLRQGYATSRDLDVVLEESENNGSLAQSNTSYLDQVLDASLSNSLSFLRAHNKTSSVTYQPDIPTSVDSGRPPLQIRRARAGTMPSMLHMSEERRPSPLLHPTPPGLVATTTADTRHRSGSLNLPIPPPLSLGFDSNFFGSTWSNVEGRSGLTQQQSSQQQQQQQQSQQQQQQQHIRSSLPSPSTEQLLRGDRDFSIARTLRSLGLEDDRTPSIMAPGNGNASSLELAERHISAARSLLTGTRNRSYSVNAAARYQEPTLPPVSSTVVGSRSRASSVSRSFANPLDNLTVSRNRPRASSMGRMDFSSPNPPMPSSLWQMQRPTLDTLTDDEPDFQEPYSIHNLQSAHQTGASLPLDDTELLAHMLHNQNAFTNVHLHNDHDQNTVFLNGSAAATEQPLLHYSQSTPTTRTQPVHITPSTSSSTQVATRSLWIGNIDATVSLDVLTRVFSPFGPIESVRLLQEKECAFVNFFHIADAVRAKETVLGHMGGRVGQCIVRIGYGKADAVVNDTTVLQPTRALWLGNLPPGTSPTTLQQIFAPFGAIESARVLSHKNCGFVNFETVESASDARDALLQNNIPVPGFTNVRVGFAKVPPSKTGTVDGTKAHSTQDRSHIIDHESYLSDLWETMSQLNANKSALELVKGLETPSSYFESIPPVPELGSNRKFDASRLRDLRKKLDNAASGSTDVESIAADCMAEIAELSSDYIGNTLVQRLFDKCTEDTKTAMLKQIAPHLAAIGIHKNGTWAAQKIIDTINTPEQIDLVCTHLKPYVPPLLLDQFGNYVVQCCLRLDNGRNQFIFDAMVEKLLTIAQGRFGARAMRGILDNNHVSADQQMFVSAAIIQHSPSLAMNANGALLLSWLIDSPTIENRHHRMACRLVTQLTSIATHKVGSQVLFKLVNQDLDALARETIYQGLLDDEVLEQVLADNVRGLPLVQKMISCPHISTEQQETLSSKMSPILDKLQGNGHNKADESTAGQSQPQ